MKNLFLLLLAPMLSFAQTKSKNSATLAKQNQPPKNTVSQVKADGFSITGNVQGLADGDVKVTTTQGDKTIASGEAKNGVFNLQGKLEEPGLYWITLGKEQPQYIFLENAPVKITGTQASIKNIKIEGSNSHNEFLLFQQIFNPLFADLNAVVMEINRTPDDKKEPLMNQYHDALEKMNSEVDKFVAGHRASYVSLFTISVTSQATENIFDVEKRFNLLDAGLKNSKAGKEVQDYIAYAKVGAVGTDAINFTQNDVTGKPVALSQFKGKYVLVDFWASWCKPCRYENPNVVKVYNKFKDRNFTILSVSLDQEKNAWLKAIEKDSLAWTHVSDLQFWNNSVAQLYHVQSIPQNFLIDPNGKIVAKDLRGVDLEKKLCAFLGCSN